MRRALALAAAHPRWSALALGALSAFGFQPFAWWPIALLCLAGLIELTARSAGGKRAAQIGWTFGLGHFAVGLNWIATAFTYQSNMPAALGWVAVAGLAAFLALYPAIAAAAAWRLGRANYGALVTGFAASWIVTEWLRSWVFTGFAWNPLGVIALGPFARPAAAQAAPSLGTYGLSGLVILFAGAWLIAIKRWWIDWRGAALVILPIALMLMPAPAREPSPKGVAFTLVQPDIRQDILNDPASYGDQFNTLAALTRPLRTGEPRLVLWPESGVPDYLREGYPSYYYLDTYAADPVLARRRLGRTIGPGAMLLTGTVDLEVRRGKVVGGRNAVTALDDSGAIRASYAKAHLVPGGEYLPLRWLLVPLGASRLVPGDVDFWPGPGPRTLDLGAFGKAGVQICYEIVFSGQVIDRAHRPDYIFNPSNDGWFGSWGPPQHLAQARLRAIEEGLPVLRSTTTGISAVIDADGVVRNFIPRLKAGRIDAVIPPPREATLFARAGNLLPLGWSLALLALTLVASRRRAG